MDALPAELHFHIGVDRTPFQRRRDRLRALQAKRRKEYWKQYYRSYTYTPSSTPVFIPKPTSVLPYHYFIPTAYTDVAISLSMQPYSVKNRYKLIESYQKANTFFRKISKAYVFPRAFKAGPWTGYIASLCHHIRREIRIRHAFLRLLGIWLHKRYKTRLLNSDDPFTLEPPKCPVYLFDPTARGSWVFEASALRQHFEHALTYSEHLFPCPKVPKHPLTNVELSRLNYTVTLEQLRVHGQTSWILEAFRSSRQILAKFKTMFCVPSKLHALEALCRTKDTEEYFEMLEDYVYSQMTRHKEYSSSRYNIIMWALRQRKDYSYSKSWHTCFYEYYRCRILGTASYIDDKPADRVLALLFSRTRVLCSDYETIAELGDERLQEQGLSVQMFVEDSSSPDELMALLQILTQAGASVVVTNANEDDDDDL